MFTPRKAKPKELKARITQSAIELLRSKPSCLDLQSQIITHCNLCLYAADIDVNRSETWGLATHLFQEAPFKVTGYYNDDPIIGLQ